MVITGWKTAEGNNGFVNRRLSGQPALTPVCSQVRLLRWAYQRQTSKLIRSQALLTSSVAKLRWVLIVGGDHDIIASKRTEYGVIIVGRKALD